MMATTLVARLNAVDMHALRTWVSVPINRDGQFDPDGTLDQDNPWHPLLHDLSVDYARSRALSLDGGVIVLEDGSAAVREGRRWVVYQPDQVEYLEGNW